MSSAFNIQNYTGGALKLLASVDADSDSSVNFIDLDDTYNSYYFTGSRITTGNNNAQLRIRTSSDNGSSFDSGSGAYAYIRCKHLSDSDISMSNSSSATHIKAGSSIGNVARESGNFSVYLFSPSSTDYTQVYITEIEVEGAGDVTVNSGSGRRNSAAAVDAVQFFLNSGTFTSGHFRMYGVQV